MGEINALTALKKVLLVDDHPLFRDALNRLINAQDNWQVCAEAGTVAEAHAAIARYKPHVAIVDLSLPDGDGLDLIRDVHIQFPRLRILVLSTHKEEWYAAPALHLGANGYLMKQASGDDIVNALGKVSRGHIALSEPMVAQLIDKRIENGSPGGFSPAQLSNRELQVFRLLGQGMDTQEIARTLRLAASTVDNYRANIKLKLNLPGITAIVALASRYCYGKFNIPRKR